MEGGNNGDSIQGSGDTIQEETNNLQGSVKTVEIKIKTLDSQVYTCHVEETISVPALKEQIATLTGVPVVNQRLICRGRVLKDDHILSAYNVEDGHTLHLVTRQFPQPGAPSSSGGTSGSAGDGEQQASGVADSPPALSRNRSGQVSHSVVLGTFNIPDPGDGVVPDVGRIITSMLTSLGITNLVPTNAGANSGVSIGGTIIPTAMRPPAGNLQEGPGGAGGERPQVGPEGHHPSPAEQAGLQNTNPQIEGLNNMWPIGGATPASGQHIRLMQQAMVVPDALTTMSHYLNRLEQVFAVTGQHHGQGTVGGVSSPNPGIQMPSAFVSQPTSSQAGLTGHPTPSNLGSMVRRAMGLFSSSAGMELARLASHLENEPNLADATARGDLQALALRSGILMQHLGALLLELGRSTLTLRMGSTPVESAVNPGPALFISPAGPNPMMVQPLPFQPGAGFGSLPGVAQQNIGAVGPSLGSHDVPRNINIHIHASDSGLASGVPSPFPIPSQVPLRMQSDAGNNRVSSSTQASNTTTSLAASTDRSSTPIPGQTTGALNQSAGRSNFLVTHNVPVSMAISGLPATIEQAGARMMPMRTVVAAMPVPLHNRPPTDTAGNALSAFYPLFARFQQLNSMHVPQQGSGLQAASSNRVPPAFPIVQPDSVPIQQPINPSLPLPQAQTQGQAGVPSENQQPPQGQAETRPVSQGEPFQAPIASSSVETSLMDLMQQQPVKDGMDLMSNRQMPMPRSAFVPFTRPDSMMTAGGGTLPVDSQQLDVQPLVPTEAAPLVDGSSMIDMNVHQGQRNEPEIKQHSQEELYRGGTQIQAADSSTGENNRREGSGRTDSKRKLKSKELPSAPAGLGLGGLQLPPRLPRVSKQQPLEQPEGKFGQIVQNSSASSGHQGDDSTSRKNTFQGVVSSGAPRLEEQGTDGSGLAQLSAGTSQSGNVLRSEGGTQNSADIGNLLSQVLANSSGGNSSATAMARDGNQGLASPSRALGGVMGQLLQNPLFRNVVQQVADQVGEEPQGLEDMVSQGRLNFSGVLQQMMPIVSQALGRVSANNTEQGSVEHRETSGERDSVHGTEQIKEAMRGLEEALPQGDFSGVLQQVMPIVSQALGRVSASPSEQGLGFRRENAGGRGGTHHSNNNQRARNATSRFEDVLSQGGDDKGRLNLSAILQQMMPVVAQAVGQATEVASEQARPSLNDSEDGGFVSDQERWKHPLNQDKLSQQPQISSVKEHQLTTQRPVNETPSGGAPVAKRQKIDLERAVKKLEQDRSSQEIFQVIAEIATMLMAPNDNPGTDTSSLAEQLSRDDSLVSDYISLLSQDFSNQTSEDPTVKDSNSHE